jgi:hypothetical protein
MVAAAADADPYTLWHALQREAPMDEAAPQAAGGGTGDADDEALAALRFGWGEAYRIGRDPVRGWWAQRRDELGGDITAQDPDGLWQAICEDYILKPVPRDLPLPAGGER